MIFDENYFSILTARIRTTGAYTSVSFEQLTKFESSRAPLYLGFLSEIDPNSQYIKPDSVLQIQTDGARKRVYSISIARSAADDSQLVAQIGKAFVPVTQTASGFKVGEKEAELGYRILKIDDGKGATVDYQLPMFDFYVDGLDEAIQVQLRFEKDSQIPFAKIKQLVRSGEPIAPFLASAGGASDVVRMISLVFDPEALEGKEFQTQKYLLESISRRENTQERIDQGFPRYSYSFEINVDDVPEQMIDPKDGEPFSGKNSFYATGSVQLAFDKGYDELQAVLAEGGNASLLINAYKASNDGYAISCGIDAPGLESLAQFSTPSYSSGNASRPMVSMVYDKSYPRGQTFPTREFKVVGLQKRVMDSSKLKPGQNPNMYLITIDPEYLPEEIIDPRDNSVKSGCNVFKAAGAIAKTFDQDFEAFDSALKEGEPLTISISGYKPAGQGFIIDCSISFFDAHPPTNNLPVSSPMPEKKLSTPKVVVAAKSKAASSKVDNPNYDEIPF